ncbi:MAG: PQQ-binding-like beta-propeller repeat protein [Trebonia sp.]
MGQRARNRNRKIAPLALTVASLTGGIIVAGCSSSGQPAPASTAFAGAATPAGSWAEPNGDLANTRDAAGALISASNVASLKEAWTFKLAGTAATGVSGAGSFAAAPVVVNGTVYLQDLYANVYAISLATGKLKWEYPVNIPEKTGPGPDGVAVANGVVYGDTSSAAFALNAATGQVIWNDGSLLSSGQGSFEIQPAVAGDRVYLASAYGSGPGGGVLLALDASTGKELWSFNTVVGAEPGANALGLGAGGAWETPLVGSDGSVTFGTGNPYQSIGEAISHPARDLYTNSEVNLDAATGKLRWYYQAVPNDFKDWDMQLSPIAATVSGVPAILGGGKMGDVYAMNASTGALLWKTPVGVHNGTDNDSELLLEHKLTIKVPYTFEPGSLGGVLSNMALADGTVYVATLDVPLTETKLTSVDGDSAPKGTVAAGEIEALNVATGKVEWDTKVSSLPLGATTVSSDLVFTTLVTGELMALNRSTGAIVYKGKLPTTTNSPIAIAGNTILVPAGAPGASAEGGVPHPQLVAYTVP